MSWMKTDNGLRPRSSPGFDGQVVSVKLDPAMDVDVMLHKIDGGLQLKVHNVGVREEYVGCRREDAADPFPSGVRVAGPGDEHRSAGCKPLPDHSFDSRDDEVISPEHVVPAEVVDDDSSAHNSP